MPTMTALRESAAATQSNLKRQSVAASTNRFESRRRSMASPRASSRPIVGIRPSILRTSNTAAATNKGFNAVDANFSWSTNQNDLEQQQQQQQRFNERLNVNISTHSSNSRIDGVSAEDIRASPRLIGYLFQLLASTVMMITAIKFYQENQERSLLEVFDRNFFTEDKRFFNSISGPVYYWKMIGCVAAGSAGSLISLLILLVHFDTRCLPKIWKGVFRDGSQWERVLLWLILLFWICSLYVCTSSLSVGEVQANVFFTAWIGFSTAFINCGVWRRSAGKFSLAQWINYHPRETTYNWFWTLFFVAIFAGSMSDLFINRDDVTLRVKGEVLKLSLNAWYRVLVITWGVVVLCMVAILFNQIIPDSFELKCGGRRSKIVFGWRQLEGIIIFGLVVVFFWLIYEYTGVNAVLNGLNNAYFGAWGAFFNFVYTFATWLQENKNIGYIVRDRQRRRRRSRPAARQRGRE